MTAATKKEAKGYKPLNFKGLVRKVHDSERFAVFLKTATTTGWLTDEYFLTRLTDEEVAFLKDLLNKTKAVKKTEPADPNLAMPKTVGMAVEGVKQQGDMTRLTNASGNVSVMVDTVMYLTLNKRHPKATVYFTLDNPESSPIVFSEKSHAVALLVPSK